MSKVFIEFKKYWEQNELCPLARRKVAKMSSCQPCFQKARFWHQKLPEIQVLKYLDRANIWVKMKKRATPRNKWNFRWKSTGKLSLHWTQLDPSRLLFSWWSLLKERTFYSNSFGGFCPICQNLANIIKLSDTGDMLGCELTTRQMKKQKKKQLKELRPWQIWQRSTIQYNEIVALSHFAFEKEQSKHPLQLTVRILNYSSKIGKTEG